MNKAQFNIEFDIRNHDKQRCYNCGIRFPISRAHIIRISFTKKYEFDFDNVRYLCMNNGERRGCHTIWDDSSPKEVVGRFRKDVLNEFLSYIKEKEPLLYYRIKNKLYNQQSE